MTVTILDEATEGTIEALPTDEPQLLAIGDRLLRELKDTRDEREANVNAHSVEQQRLLDAYEELDLPLERREARLLSMLEQVAQALPLRGKRSRALAHGTIGWRSHAAKLVIEDRDQAEAWVKMLPMDLANSLLRKKVSLEIDKKALDVHVFQTGEVPKGCVIVPEGETFSATPSEPHDD